MGYHDCASLKVIVELDFSSFEQHVVEFALLGIKSFAVERNVARG